MHQCFLGYIYRIGVHIHRKKGTSQTLDLTAVDVRIKGVSHYRGPYPQHLILFLNHGFDRLDCTVPVFGVAIQYGGVHELLVVPERLHQPLSHRLHVHIGDRALVVYKVFGIVLLQLVPVVPVRTEGVLCFVIPHVHGYLVDGIPADDLCIT